MKIFEYEEKEIRIHEYQDAKSVIMALAKQYAGDMTVVCSKGRGRNRTEYYNYPCSFDIETTTIKPGELDYIGTDDDPPVAFPYLFQWNIYGQVIMCRTYSEARDIFSWISEYFRLACNRRLICFVHNLNFEYCFLNCIWDIDPDECFALDEHHPVTIRTRDGFMFRDSYKMTNMSLETLTKDWSKIWKKNKEIMDYSQLRTPHTILDANTYIYSALDVLSLSDAISQFLAARSECIWTNCPTSTSFIRKNLKKCIGIGVKQRSEEQKKYWRTLAAQKIDPDIYAMLKRQARGGNTHANRKFTGQKLENLCHYDITSSYPAQMVCYPEYSLGQWTAMDPGTDIDVVELFERNGYCCLFDVVLINARLKPNVTVPYISIAKMVIVQGTGMKYTDNGRYMSGLEAIQLTLYGMEWPIIKQQYDFDDVIVTRGYFSKKGYLPDIIRRFVLELYAKKTELKGIAGCEIEYALAKTYVNGIYGMCYTDPLRLSYEFEEDYISIKPPEDPETFLERYQNSVSYFLCYSWGCQVSTLGRLYLQRMIDACDRPDGSSTFVYADTDSIFALDPEWTGGRIRELEAQICEYQRRCGMQLSYKDIKGREHELGSISEEPRVQEAKFFGAKKYATVEDGKLTCTIAGVPKKAGGRIIGTMDNFQIGLNFKGAETGKNCLWYNPDPGFTLHDDQGREIEIHGNVAMLPCDYLLSLSADYMECLSVEGNFHWNFKEADRSGINEEDL